MLFYVTCYTQQRVNGVDLVIVMMMITMTVMMMTVMLFNGIPLPITVMMVELVFSLSVPVMVCFRKVKSSTDLDSLLQ